MAQLFTRDGDHFPRIGLTTPGEVSGGTLNLVKKRYYPRINSNSVRDHGKDNRLNLEGPTYNRKEE